MNKYIFIASDRGFNTFFKEMKKVLTNLLGKGITIEKIGSTTVPNLGRKDILDIMIDNEKDEKTNKKTSKEKTIT